MNKALLAVLVGIMVIGGIILVASWANTPTEEDRENGAEQLTEEYTSEDFAFAIDHAPNAEISVEGDRHVKFLVTGDEQEEATEVTDGYLLTVSTYKKTEYPTLQALVQKRRSELAETNDTVEAAQETTFQGNFALELVSEFAGSKITHVFVENTEHLYELTYSIEGDEDGSYKEAVDAMLNSFAPQGGVTSPTQTFESVKVAVLDTEGVSNGKSRGCDKVILIDREIQKTPAPLSAALKELFAINEEQVGDGQFNFIARTNETLKFDRVVIENGTAKVYLTGSVTGFAGVCDNPRPMIQIEETALQFGTVRAVEIYLNNEKTDLQPDMRGGDETQEEDAETLQSSI